MAMLVPSSTMRPSTWKYSDAWLASIDRVPSGAPIYAGRPGTWGGQRAANLIVAQLLFLEADNPDKVIFLYINSPGGSVSAGMSIFDTMQFIKPDVSTLCMGIAASMGSFLLMAGAKGKRFALPNSRVMIHQPSGGAQGQATDIEIHAREILKTREQLNRIYAERATTAERVAA
mgnify:CR=1 FL=1